MKPPTSVICPICNGSVPWDEGTELVCQNPECAEVFTILGTPVPNEDSDVVSQYCG